MKKFIFTLAAMLLAIPAFAQWSDNGAASNILLDRNYYEHDLQVLDDGSFYLAFNAPDSGRIRYYLSYFDKDGNALWEEPKLVSDYPTLSYTKVNQFLFADRDGNALVIACHTGNSVSGQEETYSVFKVDREGNSLWPEAGIDLLDGEARSLLACMHVTQIADGSYVFAWSEFAPGETSVQRICMQRLDASGQRLWGEGKILEETGVTYSYPYLEDAGNNTYILVYAYGGVPQILAQKFDFDGNAVWPRPTVVYGNGGFGTIPLWTILEVTPADGGILAAWHDDRNATNVESVYISYVKGDGSHAFVSGPDGLEVEYSDLRCFNPSAVFDKENQKIFVVFRETSASQAWQGIKTQLVDMNGELLWDVEGLAVNPLEELSVGYQSAQLGPKGTYASFYMRNPVPYQDVRAYACLQNADGSMVWTDSVAAFGDYPVEKSDLVSTPLVENQWICIWSESKAAEEEGALDGNFIAGQNIRVDGSFGTGPLSNRVFRETLPLSMLLYPNPARQSVCVQVENPGRASDAEISLVDLQGRVIDVLHCGKLPAGQTRLQWERPAGLSSGVYIVKLDLDGRRFYQKLVVE